MLTRGGKTQGSVAGSSVKVCSSIDCEYGDELQPIIRFAKNPSGKDGVRECCKKCIRKKQNANRARLKEAYRRACEDTNMQSL